MKILLIRLDKIGDLICSLPVDECEVLKGHSIHWAISKGLEFVPDHSAPRRRYQSFRRDWNVTDFILFFQFLKNEKFEMAISFQAPWWIHLGLFLTRVPKRVGVLSQWHSYLFLNKALRQKRSLARQHESEYNADLVYFAFDQLQENFQKVPVLRLQANSTGALVQHKLSKGNYVVVHPGMAGSALNWPVRNYIQLIQKVVSDTTLQVVITGTSADEPWLVEIKKEFSKQPRVLILQNLLKSNELLDVLNNAKTVIAPSTGVLHLSASLGIPSVGIYSPVQVQAPLRWEARGSHVQIFKPEFKDSVCPARFKCLGEKCIHFYCLDQIKVDSVFNSIQEVVS